VKRSLNLGEISAQNAQIGEQLRARDRVPMLAPVFHARAGWLSPVKKVGLDSFNRVVIVSAFPYPWLVFAIVVILVAAGLALEVGYEAGLHAAVTNTQLPTE
jgi:hypothetical protein